MPTTRTESGICSSGSSSESSLVILDTTGGLEAPLAGPSDHGLSAAQGTEAALISDRLSLAFQPRRDRTVEGPRTETKLICVPCDRTATAKRQRQEANYPCGPEFNFSWVFERSRH